MAGVSQYISVNNIVRKNNRSVFLISAGGVSGDAITGYLPITIGVTASAFGDLLGSSGITAGTAKLGAIWVSSGGIAAGAANYTCWSIASGGTAIHTNSADKSNLMLMVRTPVGNDEHAYPKYSIPQVLSDGKVTVTLDNQAANNSGLYGYGCMFVEFTI